MTANGNCSSLVSVTEDEYADYAIPEAHAVFWSKRLFGVTGAVIHGVARIGKPITQGDVTKVVCRVHANVAGVTKTFLRDDNG